MALSNRQIERYSRQLIVRDFGGVAQERLLAARVLLLGSRPDLGVLAYLVGAGVGHLDLRGDFDPARSASLIARMRDLNPDSAVRVVSESGGLADFDLALVLVSDGRMLDQARALCDRPANVASDSGIILARLDAPPRIAVMPAQPPCPRCVSAGQLLAPIGARADSAGFVASLAVLETIKLLAHVAPAPKPTLIEFRGYEASARAIVPALGSACACAPAQTAK